MNILIYLDVVNPFKRFENLYFIGMLWIVFSDFDHTMRVEFNLKQKNIQSDTSEASLMNILIHLDVVNFLLNLFKCVKKIFHFRIYNLLIIFYIYL